MDYLFSDETNPSYTWGDGDREPSWCQFTHYASCCYYYVDPIADSEYAEYPLRKTPIAYEKSDRVFLPMFI